MQTTQRLFQRYQLLTISLYKELLESSNQTDGDGNTQQPGR